MFGLRLEYILKKEVCSTFLKRKKKEFNHFEDFLKNKNRDTELTDFELS